MWDSFIYIKTNLLTLKTEIMQDLRTRHYGNNRKQTKGRKRQTPNLPFTRLISLHFGNNIEQIDQLTTKMSENVSKWHLERHNKLRTIKQYNIDLATNDKTTGFPVSW